MTRRRPPLIVAGGQLWEMTGRLVDDLASEPVGVRAPDLLVWDELDVDRRWAERPDTFVVRDRPLRRVPADHGRAALGARAGDLELRAHLWRRRRSDVAMVGHVALRAAPWLVRHEGRRVWLATPDDRDADRGSLRNGVAIPPADAGGPHHIVTHDLELARGAPLHGQDRHRWVPGFWAAAPPEPARPEVLAWGVPDRRHGIDLVGRALAARGDELRHLGATVRWIGPPEAELPREEADDLRRAGVHDLLQLAPDRDPEGALRRCLPGAAALVLCSRPGASVPNDGTLVRAFRSGVRMLGFGPPRASDLALARRWSTLAFGDVAAMGDALVAAVRAPAPARLPGPVGLAALFEHLDQEAAGRG